MRRRMPHDMQRVILAAKGAAEFERPVGEGARGRQLRHAVAIEVADRRRTAAFAQRLTAEALGAFRHGVVQERVTLERETFLNSLRRVSLLASDKSNSIKLNFTKNNIDITANTPEVGEAKESLAVAYTGRDFSIAFNPEFFMAPLRALTEDEVFLDLIDEMSPGVLKIQTPFLYVLMPMRISS